MLDTLGLSDDTPFPSIVAEQVARRGFCDMTVGEIVGRAWCCATDVRNALRQAVRLGLVHVEARRVAYDRNRPKVVTIVSAEWSTWLRLHLRGGGCKPRCPRDTYINLALETVQQRVDLKDSR